TRCAGRAGAGARALRRGTEAQARPVAYQAGGDPATDCVDAVAPPVVACPACHGSRGDRRGRDRPDDVRSNPTVTVPTRPAPKVICPICLEEFSWVEDELWEW